MAACNTVSSSPLLSTADIGKPNFDMKVTENQKAIILNVTDPFTAVFKDGRQLTIRDVFAEQLQYRVTYRKNKSSGKVSYSAHDGRKPEVRSE